MESYLATREECDFSDECSDTPNKPLAKSTLRLQREHLRIAASVLIKHCGAHADRLTLASVVEREAFKAVLLFFIEQAKARLSPPMRK